MKFGQGPLCFVAIAIRLIEGLFKSVKGGEFPFFYELKPRIMH